MSEHSDEFKRGIAYAISWLLRQPRDKASNSAWAAEMTCALLPKKLGVTEDARPAEDAGDRNGSERPGEKPGANPATATLTRTGGVVAAD